MIEQIDIEIRFMPQAADILPDELALIESVLPDLLRELMQADASDDD